MHSNLCRQSPPSFFCLLGHYCIHWPCLFPCFHYPFSALSGTSTHYVVRTMPLLPSKLMVRLSPGAGTAMRFVASFEARFRDFTANIWFCTSCFSGNEIKLKIWNYKCFFVEIFLDIYIYIYKLYKLQEENCTSFEIFFATTTRSKNCFCSFLSRELTVNHSSGPAAVGGWWLS